MNRILDCHRKKLRTEWILSERLVLLRFTQDKPQQAIFSQIGYEIEIKKNNGNYLKIRVITKLPNSEQSYKEKVKTHNYISRQNQSTTGKL